MVATTETQSHLRPVFPSRNAHPLYWGVVFAKQVIYSLSHAPQSFFAFSYFSNGLALDFDPPTYASLELGL
jgi:hypothetical protein